MRATSTPLAVRTKGGLIGIIVAGGGPAFSGPAILAPSTPVGLAATIGVALAPALHQRPCSRRSQGVLHVDQLAGLLDRRGILRATRVPRRSPGDAVPLVMSLQGVGRPRPYCALRAID